MELIVIIGIAVFVGTFVAWQLVRDNVCLYDQSVDYVSSIDMDMTIEEMNHMVELHHTWLLTEEREAHMRFNDYYNLMQEKYDVL